MVIGVHTPEFPFEQDVDNVREAAKEMEVEYPVALDSDYAVWRAFDNRYWPAVYIADAQGRIRHHHFGEGGYEECERVIQRLLGEAGLRFRRLTTSSPSPARASRLRPIGRTWSRRRRTSATSKPRTLRLRVAPRSTSLAPTPLPDALKLNHWALAGDWTIESGRKRAEPRRWSDRVPLPRPRRPSRHGTAVLEARPCRSACSSTETLPAVLTGSMSTRTATEPWPSSGSTSWFASRDRSATGRSRSRSSLPVSRPTFSPSARALLDP